MRIYVFGTPLFNTYPKIYSSCNLTKYVEEHNLFVSHKTKCYIIGSKRGACLSFLQDFHIPSHNRLKSPYACQHMQIAPP